MYDIHTLAGRPNRALVELAAAVDAAVRPVLVPTPPDRLPADVHDPARWHGHVSRATHELFQRPEILDEVEADVRGLNVPVPGSFTAATVSVYRFEHPTWSGPWWWDMPGDHVRSWPLGAGTS